MKNLAWKALLMALVIVALAAVVLAALANPACHGRSCIRQIPTHSPAATR